MKVIVFDASTTQTGCVEAEIIDNHLTKVITLPIKPPTFKASDIGYLNTKQIVTYGDKSFKSYVKSKDETKVSPTECSRRNREVKIGASTARIQYMIRTALHEIEVFIPNIVLMEANMSFGLGSVTKLLAEVAGAIQAGSTIFKADFEKINVSTARAYWNLSEELVQYIKQHTPAELKSIDTTKAILRDKMLQEFKDYHLNTHMSLDESDALVILHHWLRRENIDY